MDLHHGFGRLLQASGVLQHSGDVLHHVARSGHQLVALVLGSAKYLIVAFSHQQQRLLTQRIQPLLHGVVLLVAQVFKQMQLGTCRHQCTPVVKA